MVYIFHTLTHVILLLALQTVRFKHEIERNITIKLGYANAKVYKCPKCPRPQCYQAFGSNTSDTPNCGTSLCDAKLELLRYVNWFQKKARLESNCDYYEDKLTF